MKSLRELLLTLNKEGFGKIGSFDSMDVEDQFSVIKKHYHRRCLETHPDKGGNVEGKNVVLVDDMVDTAGTLTNAADLMKKRGAISVRAICTHALLSGNAYEKIEGSQLEELIVTDSIPPKVSHPKVKVLSCAPLFAEVMKNVHYNQSISSKFVM